MNAPDDCGCPIPDQAPRACDRTARALLIAVGVAVAVGMAPSLYGSARSALQGMRAAAGFADAAAVDAVQRDQAAAIARLERSLGSVIGEVAAINARSESAARDELAWRERVAKLDADVTDLRLHMSGEPHAAGVIEPLWQDQMVDVSVGLARNGVEIDALRSSIDTLGRDGRAAVLSVARRVERIEALLASREATGSVRPATVRVRPKHKRPARPIADARLTGGSVAQAEGFALAGTDATFAPGSFASTFGRAADTRRNDNGWYVATERGALPER